MSFDNTQQLFNNIDTDGNGQIDRNEFTNWINNPGIVSDSTAANGALSNNDALFSPATGTNATSSDLSPINSFVGGPQYATNAQGYYIDPNPLVFRVQSNNCPNVYKKNIQVQYLQPPKLEPHGGTIIEEKRLPQPRARSPVIFPRVYPPQPQLPPLVLRQRPPPIPPRNRPEIQTRIVPNPPPPPRSVTWDITLPLPQKPRDIKLELWRPYPPRGPGPLKVIPAPPPKPYPPPRNTIILRQCPRPRIEYDIRRLPDQPANPLAYQLRYGNSLLDAVEIERQIRADGIPAQIVDQIGFTSSRTSEVPYSPNTGDVSTSTFLPNEVPLTGNFNSDYPTTDAADNPDISVERLLQPFKLH